MGYGDSNTFSGLRFVNVKRCEAAFHPVNAWTPCEWMTAVAGEVGEAANLVKKLRRIETDGLDTPQNRELWDLLDADLRNILIGMMGTAQGRNAVEKEIVRRIGHELADVVIYVDLLAARLDIDLGDAVIQKFNLTSKKIGSHQTLPY